MDEDRHQTSRLHIRALPDEYDAIMVEEEDDGETEAIPVIPTAQALGYWNHPSVRDNHPARYGHEINRSAQTPLRRAGVTEG